MRSPVAGLALLVLLAASSVEAAPLTAELVVTRAPGADDCLDAGGLDGLIARILDVPGGGEPTHAARDVRAAIAFSRGDAGYQATLRLEGRKQGQRTLTDTSATCAALGRAVGITLALVLDTGEELAAPPPPPVAVVAASPSPEPAARRSATSGILSVAAGPALGLVGPPSVITGVELELGVGRRVRLQLAGQVVAPRATAFDTGAVEVGLIAARLGACGVLNDPDAAVRVGLCVRGVGGRLRGAGSGFPEANEAHALTFWEVGGGLQLQGALGGRFVLGAEADVLAPLRRYTFSVGNRGVAYESEAVTGMLQVAMGIKLW